MACTIRIGDREIALRAGLALAVAADETGQPVRLVGCYRSAERATDRLGCYPYGGYVASAAGWDYGGGVAHSPAAAVALAQPDGCAVGDVTLARLLYVDDIRIH